MRITSLYHWSPSEKRQDILRAGLLLYSDNVTHTGGKSPYLCFSPDPRSAWMLAGDVEWVSEIEEWDLWQVELADGDDVCALPQFGPWIKEIRVRNSIPADRLWWVAQRAPLCFDEG